MATVPQDYSDRIRRLEAAVRELSGSKGGAVTPSLPFPTLRPQDSAAWPSTTATAWTTIYQCSGLVQLPNLQAAITFGATVGGSVQVLVNGVPVGTAASVSGTALTFGMCAFSAPLGLEYGDTATITVQALAASGGRVYVSPGALYNVPDSPQVDDTTPDGTVDATDPALTAVAGGAPQ